MLSPFITKQQQEIRNKERSNVFFKDYQEVCKKHGLKFVAEMNARPNALVAVLTLIEYTDEEKSKV